MNFQLRVLPMDQLPDFKHEMQTAFQLGAEEGLGPCDEEILPEKHIDRSLSTDGAIAYEALFDGQRVGGAIVIIDSESQKNFLDFLYVKNGVQSKGFGQKIWQAIEEFHPETVMWETCTPYFDRRNLHFYINCCGFKAVEFYNPCHLDPQHPSEDEDDCFFRFEKYMK